MKTIITGGSGLVGSQLNGDIKLSSKDVNLVNFDDTLSFFSNQGQIDNVIHCAARVGGLGGNMSYKGEFFYENIMMNTNVIECSRIFGVKRLVAFLSTCVFPDDIEYPLTEAKIHLGEPHDSNYPYAYSKRMTDIQIRAYKEQYDLDYTSVIPCNIYGPNDNFSVDYGHVLPALIHKCYLADKNGKDLEVWGSGKPMREFIYSKDVAKLTEWVLNNYYESEPIILSTSQEISIKELVILIADEMGFKGKIKWLSDKPDGQLRKPSSNEKLMNYLPDFEFTPIEVGIKETVEWFKNNYPNIRK
jgi:GDP-L-fucose synthase